jgi:phasin family protein
LDLFEVKSPLTGCGKNITSKTSHRHWAKLAHSIAPQDRKLPQYFLCNAQLLCLTFGGYILKCGFAAPQYFVGCPLNSRLEARFMATKSKHTSAHDTSEHDTAEHGTAETVGGGLNGFAAFNGANGPKLEVVQKSIERAVEMNKENVEALVESMTAAAKSLEVLSGESLTFAKQVFDESIKTGKAMMAVKSPQEFMTLHSDYSRSVFDQLVNQATKVNDLGMTAMKSAFAPINERVTNLSKAVQKSRSF